MKYKIIKRNNEELVEDEDFLNEFSQYAGQPGQDSLFYLNAAVEIIEQCVDISLTEKEIEIILNERENTITLPMRNACEIIQAHIIDDCGVECKVHPLNLRLVSGKLFLPVNEFKWKILYRTEPFPLDSVTKLAIFKVADMIINGDKINPIEITKMLSQYKTTVGSVLIPH